MFQRG